MSRRTTRMLPRLENLEERWNPAGQVTVSTAPGVINIVGDPAGNIIRLSGGVAPGSIKIVGDNTVINGPTEVVATNQKVNIVMGAGDDRVTFDGMDLSQLVVNLGNGNDELTIGGTFRVERDMTVSHQGKAGVTTTSKVDIASGLIDQFEVGTDTLASKFTYLSTGLVDDTLTIGAGIDSFSRVTGAFAATLGAGNNEMNVQVNSLGSLAVTEQSSAPTQTMNIVLAATASINGDAKLALGRGSGGARLTTPAINGALNVTNIPAGQTASITIAGNPLVQESYTVNIGGKSTTFENTGGGVLGNLSITNRATTTASVNATIGTITGTSVLNMRQPTSSGPTAALTAQLSSSFISRDLRVTTTGPGVVNTTIQPGIVNGNVQVLSRGTDGAFGFTSTRLGTFNPVPAGGNLRMSVIGARTEARADVGTVIGSSVVTMTGSIFPSFTAAETKSAIITITGASVMAIDTAKVLETFSVTLRDASSATVAAANSIGGNATVRTSNLKPTVNLGNVKGTLLVDATSAETTSVRVNDADKDVTVNIRGVMPGSTVASATISNSSIDGTLRINQFANDSAVIVENTTVAEDLIQRAPGKTASTTIIGGSVAGTASFGGALIAAGFHQLNIDDASLNNVVYVGGAGRSLVLIETDISKLLTTQINGNFTGTFGGGNDDVQLGDEDSGLPSLSELVDFADGSLVNLNGGAGTDRLANVNSDLVVPDNLTLTSMTLQTTPF